MPRNRGSKVFALLALSVVSALLVACEGITMTTPEDGASETSAPVTALASETAPPVPTESPSPTAKATVITRTPTSGGRGGTVPATPVATRPVSSTPGRGVVTATQPASVGSGSRESDPVVFDLGQLDGGQLVDADGTVLAILLPGDQSFDSVCNGGGVNGSAFGASSILNDASTYGGPFGANSPFNPDSSAPPQIFLDGQFVAHLSVSPFVVNPVDPYALLARLGCPVTRT